MAVPFTNSMITYAGSPIGFMLPIIMTIILLVRNTISFENNNFLIIIFTYTLWAIFQYLINTRFNITYSFFAYYNIVIAFILISVFKTNLFLLYEDIVTKLSIVAIVGWILMIIMPSVIGGIIDMIHMPGHDFYILRGNVLFFSMTNTETPNFDDVYGNPVDVTPEGLWGLPRNSGFSWEPGRYSAMVIIALFFNMARTKFNFKNNRGFWILLFALLTTQSTTGFFSLAILAVLFIINQDINYKIFYLAVFIPLAIIVSSLPFMGEKITSLMDSKETRAKIEDDLAVMEIMKVEEGYTPQRFDALFFEYINIINDPLVGYGHHDDDSFVNNEISSSLVLSNGILKIFARYGIIVGVLFYILLYKSSKWISNYYNIKGGVIYMLLYLSISISYDFIFVSFFLAVTMVGLIADKNLRYNRDFNKKGALVNKNKNIISHAF